mmetsp:Transcript_89162/g.236964  ORF Transcript_89162/g.236964 Transcript_89162/m.236964 type:complete len:344 (-) Transcript_89162:12-1043(-)
MAASPSQMAVTLGSAIKQCQDLLDQATQQLAQEAQGDPLSVVSLKQLNARAIGLRAATATLEEEEALFTGRSDLSALKDDELNSMASDVREASRKLSIVLAAGSSQFKGPVLTEVQVLDQLLPYFDPSNRSHGSAQAEVKVLDQLLPFLTPCIRNELSQKALGRVLQEAADGRGGGAGRRAGLRDQVVSETSLVCAQDFERAGTASASMGKLAGHFSELAEKCKQISQDRERHAQEREAKARARDRLKEVLHKLAPVLLRRHLRVLIGVARGKASSGPSEIGNANTITSLFDFESVDHAHRQLEDCRDRVLQEITLRRLESRQAKRSEQRAPRLRRRTKSPAP